MAFFTIFVPDGLSERDYRRALDSGPNAVSTRRKDHEEILRSAGFHEVSEIDLTPAFLVTQKAWLEGRDRYAAELRAADGDAVFEERRNDSLAQLQAIEAGLLHRSLFVCA
jgi:hypothetical protein